MNNYNITHNNVTCTQVDWNKKEFSLYYKGHMFIYKLENEVQASTDAERIKMVIDMFLLNLSCYSETKLIEALNYIESKMEDLEENMAECGDDDSDYFEGKYQALYEMREMLTKIALETINTAGSDSKMSAEADKNETGTSDECPHCQLLGTEVPSM